MNIFHLELTEVAFVLAIASFSFYFAFDETLTGKYGSNLTYIFPLKTDILSVAVNNPLPSMVQRVFLSVAAMSDPSRMERLCYREGSP